MASKTFKVWKVFLKINMLDGKSADRSLLREGYYNHIAMNRLKDGNLQRKFTSIQTFQVCLHSKPADHGLCSAMEETIKDELKLGRKIGEEIVTSFKTLR